MKTFLIVLAALIAAFVGFVALIEIPFNRFKPLDYSDREVLKKRGYEKMLPEVLRAKAFVDSHEHEELEIMSFDGKKLKGLLVPNENTRGSIILMHGWHSGWQLDFCCALELYHSLGLNLIIPDQRAHGRSGGHFTTFGVKESRDVESWVIHAGQLFGKEHPVFISGISMGASSVMMAADTEFEENVRGIIADCGFTSPYEIMAHVIRHRLPKFPAESFLNAFRGIVRAFIGFDIKGKNSAQCVKNSSLPILLVHGEADGFVPCSMSRQVYEASGDRGTLVLVKDARHGMSYPVEPERCARELKAFIDRNI